MKLPFETFNNKVRAMNQNHSKELRLTAEEARNLHTAIFSLLEKIAALQSNQIESKPQIVEISSDQNFF